MSVFVRPPQKAEPVEAKAGPIGPGAGVMTTEYLLPMLLPTDPARKMRMALSVGAEVSWIRAAERVISGKVGGDPELSGAVKWHLEDPEGETIDEEYKDERAVEAYRLLAYPAAGLTGSEDVDAVADVQISGAEYQGEMWEVTSRHMGLAGQGYWFLDSLNEFGIPAAMLYVRPDRLFPGLDKAGNLTEWWLDPKSGRLDSGTKLELREVIQFPLEAPVTGFLAMGLIESCILKAQLSGHIDKYLGGLLAGSAKLSGMYAPKAGAIDDDGQWDQLVRDIRNVAEQPDASKKVLLMRGPMEYTRTQATVQEMAVVDLLGRNRDDLLALWGVPLSQVGGSSPAGLNSGDIRKYDEAALWQNAVVMRLVPMKQRIQRRLLNRWKPYLGWAPKLVLDIPEFDDDSPRYDKVQKSMAIPMDNDERRAMLNLDPLDPSIIGPTGKPLGLEVWMANTFSPVGIAPNQVTEPAQQVQQSNVPAWSAYGASAAAAAAAATPSAMPTDGIPTKRPEKPSMSTMAGVGGQVPAGGAGATLKAKPDPKMVLEALLGSLHDQWPPEQLDLVRQGDWTFDPKFPLKKINADRRPIARNPEKVDALEAALAIGAPAKPVALVHTKVLGKKGWTPIDGWHHTAAADRAGLSDVPAYLGEGDAAWTQAVLDFMKTIPTPADTPDGKARIRDFRSNFLALRDQVGAQVQPKMQTAVGVVLTAQRRDVMRRIRDHFDLLKGNPRDSSVWWPAEQGAQWDASMASALASGQRTIAKTVADHVAQTLPRKAGPYTGGMGGGADPAAIAYVLEHGAQRVRGINLTTRDALTEIIAEGMDEGLDMAELGQRIDAWSGWDEYRAEMIARTETGMAYNEAALASYQDAGVEQVHVTDGDDDDICAPYADWTGPIDEAPEPLGHPNCTRDIEPVVGYTAEDYQTAADFLGG